MFAQRSSFLVSRMRLGTLYARHHGSTSQDYPSKLVVSIPSHAYRRLGGRDIGAEISPFWKRVVMEKFGLEALPTEEKDTDEGKDTASQWTSHPSAVHACAPGTTSRHNLLP